MEVVDPAFWIVKFKIESFYGLTLIQACTFIWLNVSYKSHSTALRLIVLCALLSRITSYKRFDKRENLVNSKPNIDKLNINKNCKFIVFGKSFQVERIWESNDVPRFLLTKDRPEKCNQHHEILCHKVKRKIGKDNRKFISTSMIIRMEWTNQQT